MLGARFKTYLVPHAVLVLPPSTVVVHSLPLSPPSQTMHGLFLARKSILRAQKWFEISKIGVRTPRDQVFLSRPCSTSVNHLGRFALETRPRSRYFDLAPPRPRREHSLHLDVSLAWIASGSFLPLLPLATVSRRFTTYMSNHIKIRQNIEICSTSVPRPGHFVHFLTPHRRFTSAQYAKRWAF